MKKERKLKKLEEFDRKCEEVQKFLEKQDLDGFVFLSNPENYKISYTGPL